MNFKTLKRVADKDSVVLDAANDTGIVTVRCTIKGHYVGAQFDATNDGLYGIDIDPEVLLALMGLDEKGHPLPIAENI